MKLEKIIICILSFTLFSCGATSCSSNEKKTEFTVTWKNYDSTVLLVEKYNYGEMPFYKGETPTKEETPYYTFVFSGWAPKIEPVKVDVTYFAEFNATDKEYTITWKNYDNSVLQEEKYNYGEMPSYKGETPTREATQQYTYSFAGWSPTIQTVRDEAVYIAQFSYISNQYSVTWKNYDGVVLSTESYNYGSMPSYKGDTPVKIDPNQDELYYYRFIGWDKVVQTVTCDVEYTAQFVEDSIFEYKSNSNGWTLVNCHSSTIKNLIIPNDYQGKPVTSIDSNVFYSCTSLTSVVVPNTVTSIGQGAFGKCSSLESITIPFVGGSANSGQCFGYIFGAGSYSKNKSYVPSSLKTVIISEGCISIGSYAFYECTSISSVTIPGSVTKIGENTFSHCNDALEINFCGSIESWLSLGAVFHAKIHFFLYGDEDETTSIIIPDGIESIGDYAFAYCSSITSVTIPDSVISIGECAFYSCRSLISITIPDSVKSIGNHAFAYCSSLTTAAIYSGAIGAYAFYYCKSLNTLTIGGGVTSIGEKAFNNDGFLSLQTINYCGPIENWLSAEYNLYKIGCPIHLFLNGDEEETTSVTIPEGITSIKDNAFFNCSCITSIKIPDTVTSIGAYSFYCLPLTELTIGKNTISIGDYAFYRCNSLKSVNINGGSIGKYAFGYCSFINTLTFGNESISIGESSFFKCVRLTTITITENVTSVGEKAFSECTSLTTLTIDGGDIGNSAFSNCASLETLTINSGSIGERAFLYCSLLNTVIVGDEVTSIGYYAFSGCFSLESLTIPFVGGSTNSNQYLGYIFGAYSYIDNSTCVPSSLKTVIISENCTTLGKGAFYGCTSIPSIIIPNNVTSIGFNAFGKCSSLESITIPFVGGSANSGQCFGYIFGAGSYSKNKSYVPSSLKTVIISEGCISIGASAFYQCDSLISIIIPNSVTSVGDDAFKKCESLQCYEYENAYYLGNDQNPYLYLYREKSAGSCVVNSNCKFIASSAFYKSSLISVTIPNSVISIGSYAFSYTHLYSIDIPGSVLSIGENAFYECSNLAAISLGNGVISIGDYAFYKCTSISSVTIPDSVTSVGNYAFSSCHNLKSVVIGSGVKNIGWYAFRISDYVGQTIYYKGSYDEFLEISIGEDSGISISSLYFYSEEEPVESGRYWHYVDGEPTIW